MAKTLQMRIDDSMKTELDELFYTLGLDTPTAVRMFFAACLRSGSIAFLFNQTHTDPMAQSNTASLRRALADYDPQGKGFTAQEFNNEMSAAIAEGAQLG